jgi:hypothetical protein
MQMRVVALIEKSNVAHITLNHMTDAVVVGLTAIAVKTMHYLINKRSLQSSVYRLF